MNRFAFALLIAGTVAACRCHAPAGGGDPTDKPPVPAKTVVATVVDYGHLDGCTFLLRLRDSTLLEPDRLDEPYRHDGRKVLIRYHAVQRMSVCMAGKPVLIDHIEFSEVR